MDFYYWDSFNEFINPKGLSKGTTKSAAILKDSFVVFTDSSIQLFQRKTSFLHTLKWTENVIQVSCNFSLALILTEPGEIWGLGSDPEKSGFFCKENLFRSEHPVKIDSLSVQMKKISIGSTHGASISREGGLFTWGTGTNGQLGELSLSSCGVKAVPSASFFHALEVSCSQSETSVITEAGFLYIFSKKKNCEKCKKSAQYPINLEALSNDFILKIIYSGQELIVFNDKGEVKVNSSCFCVNKISNISRCKKVASFYAGVVGLSDAGNVFYVIKNEGKGWGCERILVSSGVVSDVVSGCKGVGVIGKSLHSKGVKKICSALNENFKISDNERVAFSEIEGLVNFRARIKKNPEDIYFVVKKLVLMSYLNAFRCLKMCPKHKINTLMALTHRFIAASIEKYWNLWRTFIFGYNKARLECNKYMKNLQSFLLKKTLTSLYKNSVKIPLNSILPKNTLSLVSKSSIKIALIFSKVSSKSEVLRLSRSFKTFYKNCLNKEPNKSNLFIDPRFKIEILPAEDEKDFENPEFLSGDFSVFSDPEISSSRFSHFSDNIQNSPKSQTFSNSMKILSSSSSPLIDPVSPPGGETSPKILSPKDGCDLRSQIFKKLGEKAPNIRILKDREKTISKPVNQGNRLAMNKKKNNTSKETEPPKLLSDKNLISVQKRKSACVTSSEYLKNNAGRFREILIRVFKKNFSVIYSIIKKSIEVRSPDLNSRANTSPRSWMNKLHSLGMNKFAKTANTLIKKKLDLGISAIKKTGC